MFTITIEKKVHPDTETRLNAKYFRDFHAMLPEIDILATCCPLSDETHHILIQKQSESGGKGGSKQRCESSGGGSAGRLHAPRP